MTVSSPPVDGWAALERLHKLHQVLVAATAPLLRERGLAPSILWMLGAVAKHPHPTELGRELGVPAPTVSRLLKRLEADGYVVRQGVPEDLRRYRFVLTERGAALQAEARRCAGAAMERLLGNLPPRDRAELERLLDAMMRRIGVGADGQ